MENIIKRIIEIEDKAQMIMREAREDSDRLNERIKTDDKRLASDIRNQATEKCREISASEHDGMHEKIGEINAHTREQLMNLEKKFSENKEKWVEDIFNNIVAGNMR